ncbi:glycopeptide [Lentinula lateritia]|uniref:Glycopeptide n=1 Tax=Lentinula lateritia TaxID=40482 RepID=A0ABQ8VTL3_9AGAR|nr:glycopeptide [Lentinula lateritia]
MKILSSRKFTILIAAVLVTGALAETHTVVFSNLWPTLKRNSPLIAGIAFQRLLATYRINAGCGADGQGCAMVKTTLVNPTTPGSGPSTDITLTPPPHSFSVTTDFGYFNGCNGAGADCISTNCPTAFHNPNDTHVQVACQSDNVNLAITFCE